MKNYFLLALIILTAYACTQEEPYDPAQEEWIALFNGVDLQDWTPKFSGYEAGVNHQNTFLVEDSLLKVRYPEKDTFNGTFGHLFHKLPFSYYRLRGVYRFVGEQQANGPGWAYRNNGFMLHCPAVETMGENQDFPISLELQLLGGNGTDDRPNANLCTPGTHVIMGDSLHIAHCTNSSSKTYHGDGWVQVEALVLGDSLIQHILPNEGVVMEYRQPTLEEDSEDGSLKKGSILKEGHIAIQSETHPIDFKSIEVLDLCGCTDKKAKNYKSYFVKTDNSKCIYTN